MLASVNLTWTETRSPASRIVIYGVAPIPWRSDAAEKSITGKPVTMETAAVAGEAATEGAMPLSMNAYKVSLTRTAVKRALLAAVGNRYWEVGLTAMIQPRTERSARRRTRGVPLPPPAEQGDVRLQRRAGPGSRTRTTTTPSTGV